MNAIRNIVIPILADITLGLLAMIGATVLVACGGDPLRARMECVMGLDAVQVSVISRPGAKVHIADHNELDGTVWTNGTLAVNVPVGGLAPGEHSLEATVRDGKRSQTVMCMFAIPEPLRSRPAPPPAPVEWMPAEGEWLYMASLRLRVSTKGASRELSERALKVGPGRFRLSFVRRADVTVRVDGVPLTGSTEFSVELAQKGKELPKVRIGVEGDTQAGFVIELLAVEPADDLDRARVFVNDDGVPTKLAWATPYRRRRGAHPMIVRDRAPGGTDLPASVGVFETIADLQLIAVIEAAPQRTVEVCRYQALGSSAGGVITRYAEARKVSVYAAATGKRIAQKVFWGKPAACPGSYEASAGSADFSQYGEVDPAEVTRWLEHLAGH